MNSILSLFIIDSFQGLLIRGAIWTLAVIILAYGVDEGFKRQKIKNQVGSFFLFLTLIGILIAIIFGLTSLLT